MTDNDDPPVVDPPAPMPGWPDYPSGHTAATYGELAKAAYEAQVALEKSRMEREEGDKNRPVDLAREGRKSDDALEGQLLVNYHESIREVAKASADQVASTADVVQKAAAAIAGLYTGLLGFVYAVGEVALPLRSVIPIVFLGLAIFLSTGYAAYIRKPDDVELEIPTGPARAKALDQTINFIVWSRQRYLRRASWIRAAVVSLGVGLVFLPIAFVSTGPDPSTETGLAVPSTPPWPTIPNDVSDTARPELEVAIFSAQVEEVAGLRLKDSDVAPYLTPGVEQAIWVVAVLSFVAVGVVASRGDPA